MRMEPVCDIVNAFFGAFFGFWLSNYFASMQEVSDLPTLFVYILCLISSITVNILGLARTMNLPDNPPAQDVIKKGVGPSLIGFTFFAIPVGWVLYTIPKVAFMSLMGIIIYLWWLGVLFLAIIFKEGGGSAA